MGIPVAFNGLLAVVFCVVPVVVPRVAAQRMVGRKPLAGHVESLAARSEYGGLLHGSTVDDLVCLLALQL